MADELRPFEEILTAQLQQRPEILFAILYGSAAEGDSFRDIDVGLWVDRTLVPKLAELAYIFDLADALEQKLSYPVDVRIINDAPLIFRYNVSRGKALVVNDESRFFHFLERTWDEFLDFKPIAMRYFEELG